MLPVTEDKCMLCGDKYDVQCISGLNNCAGKYCVNCIIRYMLLYGESNWYLFANKVKFLHYYKSLELNLGNKIGDTWSKIIDILQTPDEKLIQFKTSTKYKIF